MNINNAPDAPTVERSAPGSTGDIELGNRVVSVNGMRIFNGSGAPSNTVGSWNNGDFYVDFTNHHTYSFNSGDWTINT